MNTLLIITALYFLPGLVIGVLFYCEQLQWTPHTYAGVGAILLTLFWPFAVISWLYDECR